MPATPSIMTLGRLAVVLGVLLGVLLAGLAATLLRAAPGETTRVSVGPGGVEARGSSWMPAISADGRYVAFASDAGNLVAGDTNRLDDIFVHDRETGATTRVSVGGGGVQANRESLDAAISGNGRFVTFTSWASNLIAGDDNDASDIFVYDRESGATTRVSVGVDGAEADGPSYDAALTADGRFVAFVSDARNLVAGDVNEWSDVFVHDRETGTTERISVGPGGVDGARTGPRPRPLLSERGIDGQLIAYSPSISADGRYVAFASHADNLVPDDTNGATDIFLRDRWTDVTTRVSVGAGGIQGNGPSAYAAISGDGRSIAFSSGASNLVADDANGRVDTFVHDRETGATSLISAAHDGGAGDRASEGLTFCPDGDARCHALPGPALSADGRFVAFASTATNLVAGDRTGARSIFVRDRRAETTVRASVEAYGSGPDGNSDAVAISADGRFVALESRAVNLIGLDARGRSNDFNDYSDIFVRELAVEAGGNEPAAQWPEAWAPLR